jgi:beta-galactosidase beta subunit
MSWLIVYEKTTMIIERKSSAITIIDYMLLFLPPKGIDPFKRLFNWIINDPYEHKERYQEAMLPMNRRPEDVYDRCKKYFGFATSGGGETARSGLYSVTLQNAAKRCADRVLDKSLTQQITGLIIRNGRVDHEVGSHDDLVVSWLLSHWLLTMAKNISYYGIDPANVLIETNESINSNIEYSYKDIEQAKYRDRIKELFTLLSQEANSYICERYEKELRYLDSKLILKDNEFFSLADTINKARDENRQRKKDNFVKHSNHNYNDVQTHYAYLDNVVLS